MSTLPVIDCLYSIDSSVSDLVACGRPLEATVTSMNENGVEQIVLAPCTRWRCERHWICGEIQLNEVLHYIGARPTRFAGLVAYNPYAMSESLQQVTQAITERDFRGVYVHTEGSDVSLHDRRMYPLYARCVELNVPIMIQVGASESSKRSVAPVADLAQVLVEFSDLRVVAAWSGAQSCAELSALCDRFPNLFIATDANLVPEEREEFLRFLAAYPERCIWGSHGLPWKPLLDRVRTLQISEEVLARFLHENAMEVFNLIRPLRMSAIPKEERIPIAER